MTQTQERALKETAYSATRALMIAPEGATDAKQRAWLLGKTAAAREALDQLDRHYHSTPR